MRCIRCESERLPTKHSLYKAQLALALNCPAFALFVLGRRVGQLCAVRRRLNLAPSLKQLPPRVVFYALLFAEHRCLYESNFSLLCIYLIVKCRRRVRQLQTSMRCGPLIASEKNTYLLTSAYFVFYAVRRPPQRRPAASHRPTCSAAGPQAAALYKEFASARRSQRRTCAPSGQQTREAVHCSAFARVCGPLRFVLRWVLRGKTKNTVSRYPLTNF